MNTIEAHKILVQKHTGWASSREIWIRYFKTKLSFHNFRRRIQTMVEKGLLIRRVLHENYDGKWTYNGPVYEYRCVRNIDT